MDRFHEALLTFSSPGVGNLYPLQDPLGRVSIVKKTLGTELWTLFSTTLTSESHGESH